MHCSCIHMATVGVKGIIPGVELVYPSPYLTPPHFVLRLCRPIAIIWITRTPQLSRRVFSCSSLRWPHLLFGDLEYISDDIVYDWVSDVIWHQLCDVTLWIQLLYNLATLQSILQGGRHRGAELWVGGGVRPPGHPMEPPRQLSTERNPTILHLQTLLDAGGSCGQSWKYYNGTESCFYVSPKIEANFKNARKWCKYNGGDLASIGDQQEMDFVRQISWVISL